MEYQALYRKYRPHTFDDFIDQDNIKRILINSIVNNKISHAYLFSGPRGIGKTSMAKIFAKAINCENFAKNNDVCDECENCLECNNNSVDIIEIDAASNNGVDQIRELKDKISIVPSKLKYKVYIIDEVHMLTNSAFNALLKTLEEPPSHVVFILATTEFYEVPETIVSRCQCFSFSRITINSLIKRLKHIAQMEKIKITDDAIEEIAYYSNGGLRDAIGMLDKMNSFTNDEITTDIFKSINGMISFADIENFYNDVLNKNVEKILEMINKIDEQGYDFKNFIEREMLLVRDKIINKYTLNSEIIGTIEENIKYVDILNDILNRLKEALNPIVIVQIYILKFVNSNNISREMINESIKNENKIISREIKNDASVREKNVIDEKTNNEQKNEKNGKNSQISGKIHVNLQVKEIRINNSMATANINYKKELNLVWQNLNKYFVDEKYSKIAQLLSDTKPMVVGSEFAILSSNLSGLTENIYSNLNLVEQFIDKVYRHLSIVIVTDDEFEKIKNKYIEDKKNNIIYHIQEECGKLIDDESDLINQALNIFGSDLVEIE